MTVCLQYSVFLYCLQPLPSVCPQHHVLMSTFPHVHMSLARTRPHVLISSCPHVHLVCPHASGSCLWVLPLGLASGSYWTAFVAVCLASPAARLQQQGPSSYGGNPVITALCGAGEGTLLFVPSVVTLNTSIMAGFSNFTDQKTQTLLNVCKKT